MRFTRHGPVLAINEVEQRAFAVRSVWFEPGTSAYFGSTDYMTATSWDQFLAAMRRWGTPSENQVYADMNGNIGWVAAGKTPIRPNWDGLFPVPGDGRYEWRVIWPRRTAETSTPEQGWLATANQMNLPDNFPISARKVGFEWADASRWDRIAEVLKANTKLTLADAMDLQNDDTTMLARRLVALLKPLSPDDANIKRALELMKAWDAHDTEDSAAAAIYEVWIANHLGPAVVDRGTAGRRHHHRSGQHFGSCRLPGTSRATLGANPNAERDRLLSESLVAAVADVVSGSGLNQRHGLREKCIAPTSCTP